MLVKCSAVLCQVVLILLPSWSLLTIHTYWPHHPAHPLCTPLHVAQKTCVHIQEHAWQIQKVDMVTCQPGVRQISFLHTVCACCSIVRQYRLQAKAHSRSLPCQATEGHGVFHVLLSRRSYMISWISSCICCLILSLCTAYPARATTTAAAPLIAATDAQLADAIVTPILLKNSLCSVKHRPLDSNHSVHGLDAACLT